ncbi:MAG: hypothetical protein ACNI3C_02940 [Candidatus Marinarcus sp.]|uniref:hypothetical protein n=1 Tax=Candidatus Marinarcus sp. TaxID=3100987 RepID=UPI003AFF89B0
MNLPHLAPIKFAQEVLSVDEKRAKVKCVFPFAPTIAMLFEAAAQSSAAFSQDESKIGFIVSVKNLEQIKEIQIKEVIVQLELCVAFGNISEFSFDILNAQESEKYAFGILTVMIQS